MALNLAALVSTPRRGKQLNPGEAAAIQNTSAEASEDLTLLQPLYNSYKANPSPDTPQKIQNLIPDVNQDLPALLQAAHISDAALSVRITAAVTLIVTTVGPFAALIPQTVASATSGAAASGQHPRGWQGGERGSRMHRDRTLGIRNQPFLVQET